MNKIALYTYDSKGNDVFISKHLQAMEAFVKRSFGDDAKYDVFVDKTGLRGDREEFHMLMENVRKRQYTLLVVPHINRIYKPQYDMEIFMELVAEIENCGVQILDISQGSTPQEISCHMNDHIEAHTLNLPLSQ